MRLAGGERLGPGLILCCAALWKQSLGHGTCDPLAPDLHRLRWGGHTEAPPSSSSSPRATCFPCWSLAASPCYILNLPILSGKCKTRKITLKYYKVAAAIWSIIVGKRELEFHAVCACTCAREGQRSIFGVIQSFSILFSAVLAGQRGLGVFLLTLLQCRGSNMYHYAQLFHLGI